MWLIVKGIQGFRHTDTKTVYRRMTVLERQHWIAKVGNRPGWLSKLYEITVRGHAALEMDGKSIEDFLQNATDEQLLKFIDLFS